MVCQDEINFYIVIPPYRSDYKKLLPEDNVLFEKVYKMNFENVKMLNFYNSKNFDDSDFGDTDHLNEKGAMKLTREIRKIIEK